MVPLITYSWNDMPHSCHILLVTWISGSAQVSEEDDCFVWISRAGIGGSVLERRPTTEPGSTNQQRNSQKAEKEGIKLGRREKIMLPERGRGLPVSCAAESQMR